MKTEQILKFFDRDEGVDFEKDGFRLFTLKEGLKVYVAGLDVCTVQIDEENNVVFTDAVTDDAVSGDVSEDFDVKVFKLTQIV